MIRIVVSFSGGKDSQAALIWAVKKYGLQRVEAVFCDTRWEHPITVQHVHDICEQMCVKLTIIENAAAGGFEGLCKRMKCFPVPSRRACTYVLKVEPMIDWILEQNDNLIIIQGIRAGESAARAKYDVECSYFKEYFQDTKKNAYRRKDVLEWCRTHDASILRPIFQWSAQQVIDYILDNGQQPNDLYRRGASRVGCFPCVMSRLSEIRLVAKDEVMKARLLNLEREVNKRCPKKYAGFFKKGYIPEWACRELGGGCPTAKEVFDYVCRNDEQLDMFDDDSAEYSCMSIYHGLCE